jgi:hypothetical protein
LMSKIVFWTFDLVAWNGWNADICGEPRNYSI